MKIDMKKDGTLRRIISPTGVVGQYAYITRYDDMEALKKQGKNVDEAYRFTLILEGTDADRLMAAIDEHIEAPTQEAIEQANVSGAGLTRLNRVVPYAPEEDEESGEETGRTIFYFKQKAFLGKGDERRMVRLPVFDATSPGEPGIAESPVYGGAQVMVSFGLRPYCMGSNKTGWNAGVSNLTPYAVLVKEFQDGAGGSSADRYGFEWEDDDEDTGTEPTSSDNQTVDEEEF